MATCAASTSARPSSNERRLRKSCFVFGLLRHELLRREGIAVFLRLVRQASLLVLANACAPEFLLSHSQERISSPDERSEIRGRMSGSDAAPGFRSAQPGLQEQMKRGRNADRRIAL